METIQVVLDSKLLKEAERAARKSKINRSALIREALRGHLRLLKVKEMEDLDRLGYAARRQDQEEAALWERDATWPGA